MDLLRCMSVRSRFWNKADRTDTARRCTRSQSYDFGIYSYNASVVFST
jgi:hypothetical protein